MINIYSYLCNLIYKLKNNQKKKLEYPTQLTLETTQGVAKLEKIYFTELGHIMAKVYYPNRKEWIRYTIGNLSELVNSNLDFSNLNFTNYKERIYKRVLDKC